MASSLATLSTLLKRLEAATCRLEDIALAQTGQQQLCDADLFDDKPQPSGANEVGGKGKAHEQPAPAPSQPPQKVVQEDPLKAPLSLYIAASEKVHPLVHQQALETAKAFATHHTLVVLLSRMAPPNKNSPEFAQLFTPLLESSEAVAAFTEKRPPRELDNHLKAVAESLSVLSWMSLPEKPAEFINEMIGTAQFYTNRILTSAKNDPSLSAHAEWANAYIALLRNLLDYVKKNHSNGLAYNSKGITLSDALKEASSSSAQETKPQDKDDDSDDDAPPPPPAVPKESLPDKPSSKKAAPNDMSAVFDEINKGDLTSSLRKVDKSEMTHKNPSLRANTTAPTATSPTSPSSSKRPAKPPKPASFTKKAQPKLVQDGNKFIIENYENDNNIVIPENDTTKASTVLIFGCKKSTIQIQGKINAISMVSCKKTSLLIDSLVSSLTITSSSDFTVQILGTAPFVQIDGTDSGELFLSKHCLDIDIVTSKSNTINVSVPSNDNVDDPEFVQYNIPEQFKTTITSDRKIKNEVVPVD